MKKLAYSLAFVTVIALSAFTLVNSVSLSSRWQLDDGYSVKFSSNDPTGIFSALTGDILFDLDDLEESKFDMSIEVRSINTGNGMQNQHAKSEHWLDAAKYPEITFVSDSITADGDMFEAVGNLFIHGVTKELTMSFCWEETSTGGIFTSTFDVNRNDFNIGQPGGDASEVITLDITVPVKP